MSGVPAPVLAAIRAKQPIPDARRFPRQAPRHAKVYKRADL